MLKIKKYLDEHGIKSRIFYPIYGQYFDGNEHGATLEGLEVHIDKELDPLAYAKIRFIRDLQNKYKKYAFNERSTNAYYVLTVLTKEDDDIRRKVTAEADIFLDAFWNHIHYHGNDQKGAINAGHEALRKASLL